MLEMMMNSLMSKEVLYEPLKELSDKVCCFYFPSNFFPLFIGICTVSNIRKYTLRNPFTLRQNPVREPDG